MAPTKTNDQIYAYF